MHDKRASMDPIQVEEDRDAVAAFYGAQPLLFDSTRRSVSIGSWLRDMEWVFEMCHIKDHLQVSLASRCFIGDSRLWWVTLGEPQTASRTWAQFRTVILARYGPPPLRGIGAPIRDPEIYRDMIHTRYQMLAQNWHTYPGETMSHYCWRFQEAMLPYVPQDITYPDMEALKLLRNGVPTNIRQFVLSPTLEMTFGSLSDRILEAEIVARIVYANDHIDDFQVPVEDNAGRGG